MKVMEGKNIFGPAGPLAPNNGPEALLCLALGAAPGKNHYFPAGMLYNKKVARLHSGVAAALPLLLFTP